MIKTQRTTRPSPTPELIREAALELASELGWNKLTVRALADKLGYTPPILYQHFENKDHLLQAIMEEGFATLIGSMQHAAQQAPSPQAALVAVARARFRFAERQSTLHSLMFGSGGPCWQREATFKGMMEGGTLIKGLLQAISGRSDDCRDLKTNFVALIKGYCYFASELPQNTAAAQFFPDTEPEDALAEAMQRFITSIEPNTTRHE